MRLILEEIFWFLHISYDSMVKFNLFYNSQWIVFTSSCLVFLCFCAIVILSRSRNSCSCHRSCSISSDFVIMFDRNMEKLAVWEHYLKLGRKFVEVTRKLSIKPYLTLLDKPNFNIFQMIKCFQK